MKRKTGCKRLIALILTLAMTLSLTGNVLAASSADSLTDAAGEYINEETDESVQEVADTESVTDEMTDVETSDTDSANDSAGVGVSTVDMIGTEISEADSADDLTATDDNTEDVTGEGASVTDSADESIIADIGTEESNTLSSAGNSASDDTEVYEVSVVSSDSSDSVAVVDELSLGATEITIEEAGTVCGYSFTPEETGYYNFYTTGSSESTYVQICDSDDTSLLYRSGADAGISYLLTGGTTYYVYFKFNSSSTTGTFTANAEYNEPVIIDEMDYSGEAVISFGGAYAVYSFSPEETGYYNVYTDSDNTYSKYIYLYDSSWSRLTYTSGSAPGISYELDAGETYYVVLYYKSSSYTDNIGFTFASATTEITEVGCYTADAPFGSAYNIFKFTAEETGYYIASVDSGSYSSSLYLYDSSWNEVDYDYGKDVFLVLELTEGETYYYLCEISSRSSISEFTFTLEFLDLIALTETGDYSAEIALAGDSAWYSFTPSSAGVYTISLEDTVDAEVVLYDSFWEEEGTAEGEGASVTSRMSKLLTYYIRVSYADGESAGTIGFSLERTEATAMEEGTYTIEAANSGFVYYSFTPEEKFYYEFCVESDADIAIYLYSSDLSEISSESVSGGAAGGISYLMSGGATYYILLNYDAAESGSFSFSMGKYECTEITEEGIYSAEIPFGGACAVYSFTPEETGYYNLYTESDNTYAKYLNLYNSSWSRQTYYSGSAPGISYLLTAGETYYFVLYYSSSSSTDSIGFTFASATTEITEAGSYTAEIPFSYAYEVFAFTPEESGTYKVSVDSGSYYASVYLYDSSWSQVSYTYSVDASLTAELTAGETYYYRCYVNASLSKLSEFTFTLESMIPIVLTETGDYSAEIVSEGDSVYYSFTPDTSGFYTISVEDTIDAVIVLSTSSEQLETAEGEGASVTSAMSAGTTYYFQLSYADGENIGTIGFSLQQTEAVVLEEGTYTIQATSDGYAYYSFTPAESFYYEFGVESDADTAIYLYDSSMSQITYKSVSGGTVGGIQYFLTEGETYYIMLDYDMAESGSFSFSAERSECKEIVEDGSYTAGISFGGAYAVYSFTPEETGYYNLYTESDNTYTKYIYLYNSSWSQQTYDSGSAPGISRMLTAGETYYILLGYSSSYTDSMSLVFASAATEITGAGSYTVEIPFGLAYRVIVFTPEESGYYMASMDCGSYYAYLYLYDSSWSRVGYQTGYDVTLTRELTAGETYYYLCHTDEYYGKLSEFTFTLESMIPTALTETGDYSAEIVTSGGTAYYSFTPDTTGPYTISVEETVDAQITLCTSSWSSLAAAEGEEASLSYMLTAGTTYNIKVSFTDTESTGTIDFSVEETQAIAIEEGTYTIAAEYDGCVYYSFTPSESGYYQFYPEGDLDYAIIYLCNSSGYVDNSSKTLLERESYSSGMESDYGDTDDGSYEWSRIQYLLTGGETYYILVVYEKVEEGSFCFSVEKTECVEITEEGTCSVEIPFVGAYNVFSYTPEESGVYTFTSSGDYYRYIYAYDSSWSLLNKSYGYSAYLLLSLTAGETYYFMAYSYASLTYMPEMTVTLEEITPTILSGTGEYTAQTDAEGAVTCYAFTPEESGYYNFYTADSEETELYLYSTNWKVLDSDAGSLDGSNAALSYLLTAGETYYILLICTSESGEAAALTVEHELEVIEELDYSTEAEIDFIGGFAVYSFTPEETSYYNMYTTGDSDTYMQIYNSSWSLLNYNNDGGTDSNAAISYKMTVGETYYIVLRFYSSSESGSFGFTFTSTKAEITETGSYTVEILFTYADQVFEFTPEESGYYKVSADSGIWLYLYDSSWDVAIDSAKDTDPYLIDELTAGETYYYVCYVTTSLSDVSEYTFTLESLIPTVLTETGDYSAEIALAGGGAYYSFTPDTDGIYSISAEETVDASVVLYSSDGDELVSAEGSGASVFYWLTSDTTYYFKVAYADEENTGTIGFSLEMAEATAIEEGTYTVEAESDGFAFYSFTPEEDFYYEFSAESDADVTIYLYDSSMTVIDSDSASGGYLAGFQYKLTEGETYYILLLFDASEAGSFTFTAQKTECVEITEGGTYTAEIRYEDSCAFFSFTPDTSDLYVFSAEETANVSIELYGDLDMMGAIGITLLDSVQGAGASVSYRLTSGTTYYFKVAYADEESTGTIGFTFEEVETTAIEEGTYTIAAESDGYVCYSFTPDENFLYVFSAESDAAVEMALYNPSDIQLSSTSASGGSTANINYLLTGGETYSIVLAYDAAEAGSFSFTVEKVECVEMTEDGTYTAEIPFSYAYTVFSLTPEESGYYTFSASGDYYMYVYLYDSSWSYVSDDSGTEISIQMGLSAGETYYYRCYVYASVSDQPEMTVTLEKADSTELSEPGEYTAEITTAGSSVWYTFTPEESGLYKIYTTGSSDTYVELYESEDSYGEEDDNDGTDSNAYIWDWLTAGETYFVQISYADEEESGSIDFVLEQPEVSALSGTGTISIAEEDLGSVVYSFSPETDGYYNFVASGAEGMRLEVYYLSGGVWHRYGDDFKPDIRSADTRSLWASSDQTYYIFVTCEDMDDTADGELTIEPSDITEIEEGESTDLEINFEGAYEIASFTPSVSGIYTVTLTDTDTGDYVYLDIYDSEWSYLSSNYDDGGETSCTLELSIGETYYFVTQVYEYGDAICTIEVDCIESYDDGHTHDYEAEVTDPTCTEEGYTTYTCSVCGDSYVDDYTDALGHSYEEEVSDPTCTEEGYTTYTCSVCGDTYVDDYTDALGHSWDEGTITEVAGCEESGVILYTCTMCGETYEEEIPALGHSYEAEATDPTCTEQGYTTYTCSVCGDTYVDDYTDALGHSYEAEVTDPTCTEQGYTTYTCSVCDDTYVDNYTDALGHSYEAEVTDPTCTEEGYTTYTCSVCGDTYVDDYTDALGHSYEAEVTDPTCTEEGYTTYTCSVCGDTYVDDYTDALGHSYEAEVTDPTCTEEGYTTYTCSVCGDTYVDDYTDALGHSYEAVVTEPTSEEPGYTTYTCSVCGDTYVDDYTYAVTITGSNTEVTYAGSAIDVTALFEIDENAGEATYTVTAGTGEGTFDEETLTLTVTKAGTFTITVETAATDAYTAGSASAVLTVEKGEGSGSVSIEDWAYGEDAVDPVPESETNGTDNVSYSYESTDDAGYSSSEAPTAIGTYKVTATFTETDLYESCTATAEFEITKKGIDLSVSVVETKTYGDEDFALETAVDEGYDGVLTYTSSDTSVLIVDESGNVTIVGVGTAVITITASETDTYAGTTTEISITVEKTNGTLTVTEAAYTVTYGDDSFAISGISSDSTGEVTYTSSDTSVVTVDETGTVTIVGAGTAVITITAAEDSLYTEAQTEVTITVAQKDVTVTVADSTKTYGDEDPELTYTAEGLEDGDELTGLFSIRTEGEDVGAYEASASQEEGANPNYNVTFMSGTLLITAKNIEDATVTLGDALTANGEEQTKTIASITVTNALGETIEVTTYEVEGNTGTEAGNYTMTITGTGNFTGSISVTFEIAEAIDTSELEELIAEAEALTETDYTAESWADLAEALAEAEEALEALESQSAVDVAAEALEDAIAALEEASVVDTEELEALIAEAEALTEDDYTAESWADLAEALADAEAALEALESQEAVDEAADALEAAIAALEKASSNSGTGNGGQNGNNKQETTIDTSALEELIAEAETLTETDYTAASWADLEDALADAQEALEALESQETVDAVAKTLAAAITALEKATTDNSDKSTVDTSALEELIAEAKALTEADYTATSWAVLAEALAAGEEALAAAESQEAVDAAAETLAAAIAALEEAAIDNSDKSTVDTSALEELIAEAKALAESDYTAASWAVLAKTLAAGEEALATAGSQEAVDEAAEILAAAIAALEKAAADNSDDQIEDTRKGDGQTGDTRNEDEEHINGLKKTGDSWYWYGNSEIVSGYTGLVYNDQTYGGAAGWYYVVNGKVDFTYTGLVKHDATYGGAAGWYYVVNGKVDFTVTDVVYNNGTYGVAGWWYVENARVDFSYTGLVKHSADNGGVSGWYYVDNAKIDFSVTGLVYNPGTYGTAGWWYVENAKIDFSVTGLVYNSGTYGGTVGWYYVKNAKVDFSFTGLFRGSDGDWYFIKAGALQGDVDGLVFNNGTYGVRGWWYMKGGKVQFSYTGAASNANGTWFVKNGMVDFGYSGTVTISGKTYTVKNGQVQ